MTLAVMVHAGNQDLGFTFMRVTMRVHTNPQLQEPALQQYVPSKRISELCQVSESKEVELEIDHFCHILFGGDQLTVACARGAQGVLSNSHNGFDWIEDVP